MSFIGNEGELISLIAASQQTANYRNQNPEAIKGHFIGKDHLLNILNQSGCMGIRVYYGIDNSGNKELIFVGVDADENDLLYLIADHGNKCPPDCGNTNSLNY